MGESIHYAVGITMFVVFLTMTVTAGGFEKFIGGEELNKHNVSQDDLSIAPNVPDGEPIDISLVNDRDQSENIEVVNVSNISDPEFNTDEALTSSNTSEAGYVFYQIPDTAKAVNIKTDQIALFEKANIKIGQYPTTSVSDFDSDSITNPLFVTGESTVELEPDATYLGVAVEKNPTQKYIYDIGYSTEVETGLLGSISRWLDSAVTSMVSWVSIMSGLPSSLAWIGTAIGLISMLVILYIITW